MTALEVLRLLPSAFNKDAADNVHLVLQYAISTPAYVTITDGKCFVTEGLAESPTITLRMSDENFIAVMTGKKNAMMAFMMGQIKADGDLVAAQKVQSIFDVKKLATLVDG